MHGTASVHFGAAREKCALAAMRKLAACKTLACSHNDIVMRLYTQLSML